MSSEAGGGGLALGGAAAPVCLGHEPPGEGGASSSCTR